MSLTIEKFEALLDKKFSEFEALALTPIRESIDSVKASLHFLSSQYDDLSKSVKDLSERNKVLQVENASLRSQLLTMTNDINQQKDALNDYEQYSRRECLEISGIPKKIKEDTNQIVIDIGEMLGIEITEDDLSVSHRVPPNKRNPDRPPAIIAKFVRRDKKEELYRARKLLRNKSTQDLDYLAANKIYISESLTQKNRELFQKCLQMKKAHKFKFIWTNAGKIYLRKDERPESRVHHVTLSKDLDKLSHALQQSG